MVSLTPEEARRQVAAVGRDPDDEWLLMYLAGLTSRRIAALCGVHPNAVHNRLRGYIAVVPGLQQVHQDHRPGTPDASPAPHTWVLRLEEVVRYRSEYGQLPHAGLAVVEHARLGRWLDAQRRKHREGTLAPGKVALLEHVKGWRVGHRKQTEQKRWDLRLQQLLEFFQSTGRLPTYRSGDPYERTLGTWLHGRRIQANGGTLDAVENAALTSAVPIWRGRTAQSSKLDSE